MNLPPSSKGRKCLVKETPTSHESIAGSIVIVVSPTNPPVPSIESPAIYEQTVCFYCVLMWQWAERMNCANSLSRQHQSAMADVMWNIWQLCCWDSRESAFPL